jgi:hypothetical protein
MIRSSPVDVSRMRLTKMLIQEAWIAFVFETTQKRSENRGVVVSADGNKEAQAARPAGPAETERGEAGAPADRATQ